MRNRNTILLLGLLLASAATGAQAQETQTTQASNQSGVALEFQGRLSILSLWDAGGGVAPRFIPPVAIGVRLLDQRLYLGLGLAWQRQQSKTCPAGGGDCANAGNTTLFALAPVVSFDVLNKGPAHLYPLVMLHLGINDLLDDNDFLFGMNAGIGLRGDLGDAVSIGTEWGYGFLRGGQSTGGASFHATSHGFWGTLNVNARIGL